MDVKTYHIRTFGCQMNDRDSERIAALLEGMGYVPGDDDADVIVLNTCSVREKPEHKVYSEVGRYQALKKRNPNSIVAIAGCVAQQEGESLLKRVPHLDIVMGTRSISRLPDLILAARSGERIAAIDLEDASTRPGLFGAERPEPAFPTAFVVAMTGCSNHCTYCIVPSVRGPAVTRPHREIVAEIEALVKAGVVEVTLLGQNVNSYGLDLPPGASPDFADLLGMVSSIPGIERVRFTTSHPKDLSDRLIKVLAENPKIAKYLHLPIQAGSDRVLKRMGRGYDRAKYLDLVAKLKAAVPDLALSGDFIVGFPGETDEDFESTMDVIERVRYHQIYSFRYSERPGTAALQIGPPVDYEIGAARLKRLQTRQDEITAEIMESIVGRSEVVIVEGPSKSGDGKSTGRTSGNLPVHVPGLLPKGKKLTVRITRALRHSLEGEVSS